MKKYLSILTVILFSLTFLACFGDDKPSKSGIIDETGESDEIIDNSIISLPSCITKKQTSKTMKPGTAGGVVYEIYEGIRENVGAIDEWVDMVKDIVKNINLITVQAGSGDWTNDDPAADSSDPKRVVWAPDTEQGYETKVELYWGTNTEKGFEAYVTIDEENKTAKGVMTFDFQYVDDADTSNDNLKIQLTFDGTVEPKIMEIEATGMDGVDSPDEPENAWVKVTNDENHVFTLSGNYYFDDITLVGDSTDDRNYVFKVAGYDEIGAGADKINQAMMYLAMPESSLADVTEMWNLYSVGNIYSEEIIEIWNASTEFTALSIKEYSGLTDLPDDFADYEPEHVIMLLEWAMDNVTSKPTTTNQFASMLYIVNLVNPAYYKTSTGFLGTWDGIRGTLDEEPAGFSDLSPYMDDIEVKTPNYVETLVIDFL